MPAGGAVATQATTTATSEPSVAGRERPATNQLVLTTRWARTPRRLATGVASRRTGRRAGHCASFWREQRLAAQTHLAGRVDVDDLHHHLLAFLELVADVLDA